MEYSTHPIWDKQGKIQYLIPEGRDITEYKKKEEQLRQSQKMDVLGKFTGGIAHDYNNILAIIKGFTELINNSIDNDTKLTKYTHQIQRATERGAVLTRKLLTFTQQKIADIQVINLNDQLNELQPILEKTLTPNIILIYELADNLWSLELNSGDLEDVIINMSINAMHSMESGGQLSIRTLNKTFDEKESHHLSITGDYVLFMISDTGCGMDNQTKEKIFEPFFSTKKEEGTGLGLSQVFNFMKQVKGEIEVFSELDIGTRFVLYFPATHKMITEKILLSEDKQRNFHGTETLLIVDDEPSMLDLAYEILTEKGYTVFTAINGKKALIVLEQEKIDLIVSDVIMPQMNGYQLANHVQTHYPHIKIQIASGFESNHHTIMEDERLRLNILYKPYNSYDLLMKVRDLLDDC